MKVAFYAPMKPPNHPTPSGDRRMGRLFLEALEHAGFSTFVASDLRLYEGQGSPEKQHELIWKAEQEADRLEDILRTDPPSLWFTYHCYYKAPDLLGPRLAKTLGIPYVIAEASRAKKRLKGPWAEFARRSEMAIDDASLVLAMTRHDLFALERDAVDRQIVAEFLPFLDPGPAPNPSVQKSGSMRLLTVAMMREDAKLASYQALAEALAFLRGNWTLDIVGDGPARPEVEAAFASFAPRVQFLGAITDTPAMRELYETADIFVWPGIEEAYGMVYLEAQAAGTPVVAEDWPGPRAVLAPSSYLTPPGNREAFAQAIRDLAAEPDSGKQARDHVLKYHNLEAAARRLRKGLEALL